MFRIAKTVDYVMTRRHNEVMRFLTVRNVPEETYQAVSKLAKRHRRSMQQEALILLDRARLLERFAGLEEAREMRARLEGRPLGDTVLELRRERLR